MSLVCQRDGVTVIQSRNEKWVHIDALPKGVEPHDVEETELVSDVEYRRAVEERVDVHGLAAELLEHHMSLHPFSDCAFAQRLAAALQSNG